MPRRTDLSTFYSMFATGLKKIKGRKKKSRDPAKPHLRLCHETGYSSNMFECHIRQHSSWRTSRPLPSPHLFGVSTCWKTRLKAPNPQEESLMRIKSLPGKPNEIEQSRLQSHTAINPRILRAECRITTAAQFHHGVCSLGEPEKDGFQHVKTPTECQKKWHATCGVQSSGLPEYFTNFQNAFMEDPWRL